MKLRITRIIPSHLQIIQKESQPPGCHLKHSDILAGDPEASLKKNCPESGAVKKKLNQLFESVPMKDFLGFFQYRCIVQKNDTPVGSLFNMQSYAFAVGIICSTKIIPDGFDIQSQDRKSVV